MKKAIISGVFFLFGLQMVLISCKHDVVEPGEAVLDTDSLLYAKSLNLADFTWYRLNDSIKRSSTASPHSKYFRVRFNSIAQAALTDNGRLPQGGVFPEGSFVVKELYDSTDKPLKYVAMMYKDSKSLYQSQGWVWLELTGTGGDYIPAAKKGVDCVSCHATNSRDYIRLFDLF